MTEKLNNLLFHPSTLIQYRYTHLLKALFFLFILSIISILVPIIDQIKNPELTIADRSYVESFSEFNFDDANLPNCELADYTYTCSDEASKQQVIASPFNNLFKVVSDEDDTMRITEGFYYIKFTKDSIKIEERFGTVVNISYRNLPKAWQSFDFEEVKNANNPGEDLYFLFIEGYNDILVKLTPFILLFQIFFIFISKIIGVLFYSLLFYWVYKRYDFKYKELFKLTIFAQTLPIILGLIFNLIGFEVMNSFILITITFIYVNIAVLRSVPQDKEF